MSKHLERANQILSEKTKRKEQRIDAYMAAAREQLQLLEDRGDPYAMHKAVEGMPPEVLIDIVARTSDRLLTKAG